MIHEAEMQIPERLGAMLLAMHEAVGLEVPEQTARGGTQVSLASSPLKMVNQWCRDLLARVRAELDADYVYAGIWTTALHKEGFHTLHTHPKGEYSGVCYVQTGPGGLLHLQGYGLRKAVAGEFVLFPSTLPHEVTTYWGDAPRLSVAFDLVRQ